MIIKDLPLGEIAGLKIVLGVCGSIAAYKAAYLARELIRSGAIVRVVMTEGALAFIQPLTFQALTGEEAHHHLLNPQTERAMGHIELARWADYLLIAPASADFIAKIAHGIADDLLSTLYLATRAPVIICPAMNLNMWVHPATMDNCFVLQERGVAFCGPDSGVQACNDLGLGRLVEAETILALLSLYPLSNTLKGKDFIITAGPTHEAIDPVRYIGNHSSGKMGYALAQAAQISGARVTLVSGPSTLSAPFGVKRIMVSSAEEMFHQVMQHLRAKCIFIGAAAVADYKVEIPETNKIKRKDSESMIVHLHRTVDVLSAVVQSKLAAMVIGFAAETHDVLRYAINKFDHKHVDMMIANQVGQGLGFGVDENQVTVITAKSKIVLPLASKLTIAGSIIVMITEILNQRCQELL